MMNRNWNNRAFQALKTLFAGRWLTLSAMCLATLLFGSSNTIAHPLGNFTINHFTRIEVATDRVRLHSVIDMAEIPTFQELRKIDSDGDGKVSTAELDDYVASAANHWVDGMLLSIDGVRVPLRVIARTISLPVGAGGLETLRVELDLAGHFSRVATEARTLRFEDENYSERLGWREIIAVPLPGIAIFNSSAFSNGLSDELRSYPAGMLAAPPDEKSNYLFPTAR
jgi:hypothetical protein